jgi:hypothetical protein
MRKTRAEVDAALAGDNPREICFALLDALGIDCMFQGASKQSIAAIVISPAMLRALVALVRAAEEPSGG